MYSLGGHTDTPTSLSLSPNGNFLLSPSLSSQTLIHDVRPFSPSPTRIHRTLLGAPAGFENTLLRGAWSKDDGGQRVAVGGADRTVCIWEVDSGKIQYKVKYSIVHIGALRLTICPIASWTQRDSDVRRFPSQRAYQWVPASNVFKSSLTRFHFLFRSIDR